MVSAKPVEPGTEIYGIAYSDCSCGAWMLDRVQVAKAIREVRAIGLSPMFLIRLRMKEETLEAIDD